MEQLRIEVTHPDERDGSPLEVAHGVLDDIDAVARQLAPILQAAERQIRNAVLDQIIGTDEQADPKMAADIYRDWERTRGGAAVCALGKEPALLGQMVESARRQLS